MSITSLMMFFVLVPKADYSLLATLISDVTHSALLVASSLAILVAFVRIKRLKFQPGRRD